MQVPFLDLKAQYKQIEHEVVPAVTEAMENGMFIGGPNVEGFEEEFAAFCNTKYCIGVNSGTDALRFALMAAGVGPGDEVITVPNTFIATTEAISQVGATPVFVDIDPYTFNIDPAHLSRAILALEAGDASLHPLPVGHDHIRAGAIIAPPANPRRPIRPAGENTAASAASTSKTL